GQRWPGLDVKGDGGYAIAFGRNSVGSYEWLREPGADNYELVPEEVWDFLRARSPRETCDVNSRPPRTARGDRVDQETVIRRALDQAPTNGRNNAGVLARAAAQGYLYRWQRFQYSHQDVDGRHAGVVWANC